MERSRPQLFSLDEQRMITDKVEYATFEQRLVSQGAPITRDQLREMVSRGQFYDLRHLLLFGRLSRGERRWIDAGLSAFWQGAARLNVHELDAALSGARVAVDVSQFTETTEAAQEFIQSLKDKGYVERPVPSRVGEFRIDEGDLPIVFKDGIYPHNMIGIRQDGTVVSVVIKGLSNRVGASVLNAARMMAMLHVQEAILVDNGGDVIMGYGQDIVLGSAEGERDRLKSMLLFVTQRRAVRDIGPEQLRLIEFPKQYWRADT